jgi:tRNA dimethylallyltransferase
VGKTATSLALAQRFNGEIVSADSRLFYRGMDVGTAKPTREEQAATPHHLIDITDPDHPLSLAEFQQMAYAAIDAICIHHRLPLLVGGAGQYVWAVVEGWGIPRVPPQPALRAALQALGSDALNRWLRDLDPAAANQIDPRNARRVIRALEVILVSGQRMSHLQVKSPPPYSITIVGLTCNRESLYTRIDRRVDEMLANGLVDEVQRLRDQGFDPSLPAFSSLGYREIWAHLDGDCSLEDAVERIKFETHRFARQQYTWFRPDDPRIHWFDVDTLNVRADIIAFVADRLAP